jgi:zinc/manganese transport system substrate-binding protein
MRIVAVLAASALLLTGCTTSAPAHHGISIVASTDVWGDIAKQIAGPDATIVSIISNPSQDPHSYQGDARVQLALSTADVVIENGGGYDDFVDTMLKGSSNPRVKVLDAVTISGVTEDPTIHDINEHVWYDFPGVQRVAAKLTATLSALDPSKASTFTANEKAFDAALGGLESRESQVKSAASGTGAAITEPVPLYLLEACGLVDKTPPAFSAAIEQGTDVSPLVLQRTLALFTNHEVSLLAYNEQTSGPETQQVLAAAKSAGIPVVPVTETLPAGEHYLDWMTKNLSAIAAAAEEK